jgi:exonuclease III
MSLAPKIDELRESITLRNIDLICITETWLQNHIHDNIVSVSGYNIERRDRSNGQHGGIYIRNSISYEVVYDMMNTDIEALWVKLKTSRLPRGIPCFILCNLYHPPSENDQEVINYLYESVE